MTNFKNKQSVERVQVMKRLITKLEKEQANEDTPPIHVNDTLRMLRQIVDHLVQIEAEWEPIEEINEATDV